MSYDVGKLVGNIKIKQDNMGRSYLDYMIDTDPLSSMPQMKNMPPIMHKIECYTYTSSPRQAKLMLDNHRDWLVKVYVQRTLSIDSNNLITLIQTTKDAGFDVDKKGNPIKWHDYFRRQK